jgi:hypothetical protein
MGMKRFMRISTLAAAYPVTRISAIETDLSTMSHLFVTGELTATRRTGPTTGFTGSAGLTMHVGVPDEQVCRRFAKLGAIEKNSNV